jgi:hypothetical protein
LEGYNLLSTARSLGRDYQVLSFKLDAEKRYLEKWAEVWIHGETIDPSHRDYRFAVAALAQISGVFAELAEYSSRYGITCDSSPTIRDAIRNIIPMRLRQLSVSPHRHTESPPPPQAGLDRNSIELLTNPNLLSSDDIRPDLEDEVNRLKRSAEILQKILPAKIDKDKFENLIGRLKEYNDTLHKILPMSSNLPFQRGQFASLEAVSGGVGRLIVCAKGKFN